MPAHWTTLNDRLGDLAALPRLLIVCDFDGTLAPLVDQPEEAALLPSAGAVLASLAGLYPRIIMGFLSGRALDDLVSRTGLAGLPVFHGGNHGLELRGPGLEWTHPAALATRNGMAVFAQRLRSAVSAIPGVEVEDKGLTLTLHYRRMDHASLSALKLALLDCHPSAAIHANAGKEAIEYRPAIAWDKGQALLTMAAHAGVSLEAVIYLGDDRTDEDAFAALAGEGFALRVGEGSSATRALAQADDPEDAVRFLRHLVSLRTVAKNGRG